MNARVSSSVVLPAVACTLALALAADAIAWPGDRIAARRLQRLLPPGSTVVVPRPDEIPVVPPLSPRQARRMIRRGEPLLVQPPAPTVVVKPAPPVIVPPAPIVTAPVPGVPPLPATVPLTVPPAGVAVPPPLVRQAVPATPAVPAPPVVVDRAGGPVAPAPPAAQTGAWTLAPDAAAADGTQSVLVPQSPAEPVELLPTPAPTPAER
jgi:hypothetical protein